MASRPAVGMFSELRRPSPFEPEQGRDYFATVEDFDVEVTVLGMQQNGARATVRETSSAE